MCACLRPLYTLLLLLLLLLLPARETCVHTMQQHPMCVWTACHGGHGPWVGQGRCRRQSSLRLFRKPGD